VNFGLLVRGELDRDQLAAGLADMVGVPVRAVDVSDEGVDDRNWDAVVSCTVAPVGGDLRWDLDIYISKTVVAPPDAAAAAASLAGRLHALIAYEGAPYPPTAYWLVAPDGRRARARIAEDDEDPPAYRIEAVERPVPELPDVPVVAMPEVIRSFWMPTPVTDQLRSGMTPPAIRRLGAWEDMIERMARGWPPDGWYPAAYYRADLAVRDELHDSELAQALETLDARFAGLTWDDGGRALAAETGPLPPGAEDRWWWRRVPDPPPWAGVRPA
jgi:hypothetical protein